MAPGWPKSAAGWTGCRWRLNWPLLVFAGGWTLEEAEEVCAGDGIEAGAMPDSLTRLVEKSLALVDKRYLGTRFAMLETIREFARGQLTAAGEMAVIQKRHAQAFLRLVQPSL